MNAARKEVRKEGFSSLVLLVQQSYSFYIALALLELELVHDFAVSFFCFFFENSKKTLLTEVIVLELALLYM